MEIKVTGWTVDPDYPYVVHARVTRGFWSWNRKTTDIAYESDDGHYWFEMVSPNIVSPRIEKQLRDYFDKYIKGNDRE